MQFEITIAKIHILSKYVPKAHMLLSLNNAGMYIANIEHCQKFKHYDLNYPSTDNKLFLRGLYTR